MNIARYIDHTILKPDTTEDDITKLCEEAKQYEFAAVCMPPYFVKQVSHELKHSSVKIATVVGFPFGYSCTDAKIQEIRQAIEDGADELDMVHNIAACKDKDWEYIAKETEACLGPIKASGKTIKIIIETALLSEEEIIACCNFYNDYEIDFLKTSTGYAHAGASEYAVRIMRENLRHDIAVKASGGIRDYRFAELLIQAGAMRIGTSSGTKILAESKNL